MPILGRIDYTFLDGSGNPVVGAQVTVQRPGAQIKTGGPNVFTVDDPGGILVNDNTVIDATTSPVRAVTAVGATSVTVGAGGFTGTVDDQRIAIASPLPTIYSDAVGTDVLTQPLPTDNNGRITCYAVGGKYDLLVTPPGGSSLPPQLIKDVTADGAENWRSNVFPTGSAVAWQYDTSRTLGAGDKAFRVLNNGSEEFSVGPSGATLAVPLTVAAGGIAVTGNSSIAGTLTGLTGLTSSGTTSLATLAVSAAATTTGIANTGSITSTAAITATASSVIGRRLVTAGQATPHDGTEWTLSAGWGTGASISQILGNDLRGHIQITAGSAAFGANPTATLIFKDGSFGTIAPKFVVSRSQGGNQLGVVALSGVASLTGWQFTFLGTPAGGEFYQFEWVGLG